jgi:hypothetical protein
MGFSGFPQDLRKKTKWCKVVAQLAKLVITPIARVMVDIHQISEWCLRKHKPTNITGEHHLAPPIAIDDAVNDAHSCLYHLFPYLVPPISRLFQDGE